LWLFARLILISEITELGSKFFHSLDVAIYCFLVQTHSSWILPPTSVCFLEMWAHFEFWVKSTYREL
jgi:hypothetical protein